MPPCCAAKLCKNSVYRNKNLSFFRFPKDDELFNLWTAKCGRYDLQNVPQQDRALYRLCEEHFNTEDILKLPSGRKRLKYKSMPRNYLILKGSISDVRSVPTNVALGPKFHPESAEVFTHPDCLIGQSTLNEVILDVQKDSRSNPVDPPRSFDYRPYVLIWCPHLSCLDELTVEEQERNNMVEKSTESIPKSSLANIASPEANNPVDCSSEGPCKHYIELIEEKAQNYKLRRNNEALESRIEELIQRIQLLETAMAQNGFSVEDLSIKVEIKEDNEESEN